MKSRIALKISKKYSIRIQHSIDFIDLKNPQLPRYRFEVLERKDKYIMFFNNFHFIFLILSIIRQTEYKKKNVY